MPDAMLGQPTRRNLLPGMGTGVAADLSRYVGHAGAARGGAGDIAVGEWLEGDFARAGFATARQASDALKLLMTSTTESGEG